MYVANDRSIAVAAASGVFLPENNGRVGLILSAPTNNRVSLAFGKDAVANTGITLSVGSAPLVLTPGAWG